jgi:glycosyltransferase 2 family protein
MTPVDKKEFYSALESANYWLVIPVVIMALLSHVSRSLRWKLLMETLDYHPKLKNVFCVTMVGYLANSALPRLGEILKCSFLARYEKLRADKLIGTILIERTFDIICYLVFIGLTLLVQIDLVGGFIKQKLNALARTSRMPFWGKLLILAGGIALLYLLLKFLFRKFPHNRLLIRIKQLLGGISMGFKTIKSLQKRKLFLAHTFFIWTMYLLQIYVGFHAISGTSELSIKAACTVLTLATLAMIATPGGIGSFPLFVMETLTIYGIASPVGKAFGWLIWGVSTGFIICAGLICLLILPYINRKPQKNEIHSGHTG